MKTSTLIRYRRILDLTIKGKAPKEIVIILRARGESLSVMAVYQALNRMRKRMKVWPRGG